MVFFAPGLCRGLSQSVPTNWSDHRDLPSTQTVYRALLALPSNVPVIGACNVPSSRVSSNAMAPDICHRPGRAGSGVYTPIISNGYRRPSRSRVPRTTPDGGRLGIDPHTGPI